MDLKNIPAFTTYLTAAAALNEVHNYLQAEPCTGRKSVQLRMSHAHCSQKFDVGGMHTIPAVLPLKGFLRPPPSLLHPLGGSYRYLVTTLDSFHRCGSANIPVFTTYLTAAAALNEVHNYLQAEPCIWQKKCAAPDESCPLFTEV